MMTEIKQKREGLLSVEEGLRVCLVALRLKRFVVNNNHISCIKGVIQNCNFV